MKISTKGRYALRLMLDLALQPQGEYISLKDISVRQDISDDLLRYMQEFYVGEFRKEKNGFLYALNTGECYKITVEKM